MDLACGLGHNAIWLAERGWKVDAVDISPVGLKLADALARRAGCQTVNWIAADIDDYGPQQAAYDLVIVFRFLDRRQLPQLIASALRPGGFVVYESFSQRQLARPDNHLKNSQFTLSPGELPSLFSGFRIVAQEEADLPDRSVSRLVAQKV
jgi:2-polyprenyl-3-methyl-5-hydroxy-6-metoxy-1,4-benzoquinol methylase